MPDHTDLTDLLRRASKADLRAEKAIYRMCHESCFKISRIYVGDDQEATGIFNHAMIDVFKRLAEIKSYDHLIRLTNTIVKRDSIDHLRKAAVYRTRLSVLKENSVKDVSVNEALSKLNMEEIFRHIDRLPVNYRLCFVLQVIEGYSLKEIADQLDININTGKWYVSEAKKKLRISINNSKTIKKNNHGA